MLQLQRWTQRHSSLYGQILLSSTTRLPHSIQHRLFLDRHRKAWLGSVTRSIPSRVDKVKHPERWINPDSLADTLEKHRRANIDGVAVDGVPVEDLRGRGSSKGRTVNATSKHKSFRRVRGAEEGYQSTGQEYAGRYCPLTADWAVAKNTSERLRLPWMRLLRYNERIQANVSSLQRLSDEMHAFATFLTPTDVERQAAATALTEIQRTILTPSTTAFEPTLIGSRASGLEGPMSDIDINLEISDEGDDMDRLQSIKVLSEIYKVVKYNDQDQLPLLMHTILRNARIPIVRGTHTASGLEFQIQCRSDDASSPPMIQNLVDLYPSAPTLLRLVRQMLHMRGLTNGSRGGLTSYPLLQMVIATLRMNPHHRDDRDLGAQLLDFLRFYSEIDFYKMHIAISPLNSPNAPPIVETNSSSQKDQRRPYMMSLQDPADAQNDLGRNVYQVKHIQATFIAAHQQIQQALRRWDDLYEQGADMSKYEESLLASCLEGNYESLLEARRHLRAFGERCLAHG